MSVSVTSPEIVNHVPSAPSSKIDDDPKLGPGKLCGIRHTPMSVTLDGVQISALTLALVSLIHFFQPTIVVVAVSLAPVVAFIHHDYQNFLGLGRGGTPYNFKGYLIISHMKLLALRDPFTARKPDPDTVPSKGILARQPLPHRMGPRPQVVGIAPHRQVDQNCPPYCYQALQRTLEKVALKNPEMLRTGPSVIEKHGLALFARDPIKTGCQGEVCHIHDAESSMHMALHPDDSKEVLEKGWGQRHPLGWKWRSFSMPVSADFMMVYAPRGEKTVFFVPYRGTLALTLYR